MVTTKEREHIERGAYHETMKAHKEHYEQKGTPKTERELHSEVKGIQEKVSREGNHQLYKDK